jgi:hypothetical protein
MTEEEDEYCNDVLCDFLGREEANKYIHTDKNATPIQAEIMERIMRLEREAGIEGGMGMLRL